MISLLTLSMKNLGHLSFELYPVRIVYHQTCRSKSRACHGLTNFAVAHRCEVDFSRCRPGDVAAVATALILRCHDHGCDRRIKEIVYLMWRMRENEQNVSADKLCFIHLAFDVEHNSTRGTQRN